MTNAAADLQRIRDTEVFQHLLRSYKVWAHLTILAFLLLMASGLSQFFLTRSEVSRPVLIALEGFQLISIAALIFASYAAMRRHLAVIEWTIQALFTHPVIEEKPASSRIQPPVRFRPLASDDRLHLVKTLDVGPIKQFVYQGPSQNAYMYKFKYRIPNRLKDSNLLIKPKDQTILSPNRSYHHFTLATLDERYLVEVDKGSKADNPQMLHRLITPQLELFLNDVLETYDLFYIYFDAKRMTLFVTTDKKRSESLYAPSSLKAYLDIDVHLVNVIALIHRLKAMDHMRSLFKDNPKSNDKIDAAKSALG